MTLEILPEPNDDADFLRLLDLIISALIKASCPEEIYLIRIDNWFDHKWLKFSGIGRVGFFWEWRPEMDTSLDEFHQDNVTLPPFTPNRVTGEFYFVRSDSGNYSASLSKPYVHQRKLAHSSENLHKRVAHVADSAVFVWMSSNTKANRRGSLMVYDVKGSEIQTWYVGLSKEDNWRVLQTKGIAQEQFQSLMRQDMSQERT